MSIESIKYQCQLGQNIKGIVFDKEEVILAVGEFIQLSYDQYRSMCSNAYTYITVNIKQNHNMSVKIHLDDLAIIYRIKTTKDVVTASYNPESEYPD